MADLFSKFTLTQTESGLDFDVELEPGKQVYCFIGENGCGKTSMLEALAQVLIFSHQWSIDPEIAEGSFGGLRSQKVVVDAVRGEMIRVPHAKIDGIQIKARENWAFTSVSEPAQATGALIVKRPVVLVPFGQRSVVDGIGPNSLTLVGDALTIFGQTISQFNAAVSRRPIPSSSVAHWIASRLLVNPGFVIGLRPLHFEVVALGELLSQFDSEKFGSLLDRSQAGRVGLAIAYENGRMTLMGTPIDRLASGYTALLRIFQEIVASIAAWEAVRNSTNILGSDAIILIDEIDAHLHPKWQRQLIPFLKKSFPNATFFITTHSPLIVANTDPGEAYELIKTGNKVTANKLGSPRDWYFTDVLSDAFHVDLPAPGTAESSESPPLMDVLFAFSDKVKAFARSRAEADRSAALTIYETILPRLPESDPRRKTVVELRERLG